MPALEPERAPVIVAGAAILVAIARHLGLDAIEVSEHDILDGVAFAAAELPEPEEGAAPPGAYTCCSSRWQPPARQRYDIRTPTSPAVSQRGRYGMKPFRFRDGG